MEVNKLPPEVVALTSNSSITICISNAILLPTPTQHIHILSYTKLIINLVIDIMVTEQKKKEE